MAGFNFDSIKNGFSKIGESIKHPANDASYEDQYEENAYEENYEDAYQEGYEEEYDDNAYSEEAYDDGYSEGEYEDASYDDPYYPEDSDSSDGYYDENEEDGYVEEGEYDEEYYDSEYSSDESYDSADDYDADDLGYNPAVFDNLNDEDGGYDDQTYDDEYAYDDNGVYDNDGEYYEDDGYADNAEEPSSVGAVLNTFLSFILENDIAMYVALVILPPLGIWLLWKKNKFDITVRSAISVASLIWMIVLIILLFGRGGDDDVTSNPPVDFMNHTATIAPVVSTNPTTPVTEPTAPVAPSATPNTNLQVPDTTLPGSNQAITYVWAVNTDLYYHNAENCGGMTNASKMTLDSATSRGKTACPVCVGGGVINDPNGSALPTGTQYYATARGTWYHVSSTCQGMTGASVVTEANAVAAGKTACPVCIGYYGTPGGKYYHSLSNCSKMQNAITNTEAAWISSGKTACPVCITGDNKVGSSVGNDTSTMVYATQGGKYYHTEDDCSGMKNASRISIQSAIQNKKEMCPKCVTKEKVMVFGTSGGTYFHTKSTCSGMKNALYVTAEYAMKYGKKACPTCAKMFAEATNTNTSNTTTTTGATGSGSSFENSETTIYVYATKNGTYMHIKSNCSGMANASKVTFKQAANAGKKICPECMTTSSVKVFANADGKWFHTVSDCQGMKGASYIPAKTALAYGKSACPVCAKLLSTSATISNNNKNNTTTDKDNNNTTNNNNDKDEDNKTNTTFTPDASNTQAPAGSASSKVYIKPGKPYYHVSASCSHQNVTGASAVTLEFAIDRDYKACPSCNPPSKISY